MHSLKRAVARVLLTLHRRKKSNRSRFNSLQSQARPKATPNVQSSCTCSLSFAKRARKSDSGEAKKLKNELKELQSKFDACKDELEALKQSSTASPSSSASKDDQAQKELLELKQKNRQMKDAMNEKEEHIQELQVALEKLKRDSKETAQRGKHSHSKDSRDGDLRQENEERSFIESAIWTAEPAYKNDAPQAAVTISSTLLALDAFSDSRGRLLTRVCDALEVIGKRSRDVESIVYWLSTVLVLLRKVKKRTGLPEEKVNATTLTRFEVSLAGIAASMFRQIAKSFFASIQPLLVPVFLSASSEINGGSGGKLGLQVGVVVRQLSHLSDTLAAAFIPAFAVRQLFDQVMCFINGELFNSLKSQMCTTENGFQIKLQLTKLSDWLAHQNAAIASSREQLEPILEAATLLVMDKAVMKQRGVLETLTDRLTVPQVKHVLSLFTKDRLFEGEIPSSALRELDELHLARGKRGGDTVLFDAENVKRLDLSEIDH